MKRTGLWVGFFCDSFHEIYNAKYYWKLPETSKKRTFNPANNTLKLWIFSAL